MKKRLPLPLAALIFVSLCASIYATDWTINTPVFQEAHFPTSNIDTTGDAPDDTNIVVKLVEKQGDDYITAMSKHMRSSPLDGAWAWSFPAPQTGWKISDNWFVWLLKDESPLGLPQNNRAYKVISEEA